MSYILEALKKSQQERELGQVPTLESLPSPTTPVDSPVNLRGMAALGLAGLAVVIALYAALRVPSGGLDAGTEAETAKQDVRKDPQKPAAQPLLQSETTETKITMPAELETETRATAEPRENSNATPAPVPAKPEPEPRTQTQRPPERQPASERRPEQVDTAAGQQRSKDKVPEDLRQDIEAFKQRVTEERGENGGKKETPVPPHELRLPPVVKERLPEFLMTAHIYDSEPSKRFVHIDGRKLRQGDQTRSKVRVEEILPDGAVLSFENHRFFRHR